MKTNTEQELSEGALLLRQSEPECEYPYLDADVNISFRFDSPGEPYYLDDQGVHAGDLLEMELDDGAWQRMRFEWNSRQEDRPVFIADEETTFRLEDTMRFRWPGLR